MTLCVAMQILRKCELDGWWKLLLIRSQLKFVISWSLLATIMLLFFHIFGCQQTLPDNANILSLTTHDCALNATQIILTNLNFSLICNTKAHRA
jgi:hypothetical protein